MELKVRRGTACGRAEKQLLITNNRANCMRSIVQRQENLLWHVMAQQKLFVTASIASMNIVNKLMPNQVVMGSAIDTMVKGAGQMRLGFDAI